MMFGQWEKKKKLPRKKVVLGLTEVGVSLYCETRDFFLFETIRSVTVLKRVALGACCRGVCASRATPRSNVHYEKCHLSIGREQLHLLPTFGMVLQKCCIFVKTWTIRFSRPHKLMNKEKYTLVTFFELFLGEKNVKKNCKILGCDVSIK